MYRVLVVEDEYLEREAVKSLIANMAKDCQVVGEAENGEEAIALCEKLCPDIVFMDIQMPILNGLEAAKIIKEKCGDVAIILLTAYSDFEYAREGIRISVDDYLLKPIRRERFLCSLNRIIVELGEKNKELTENKIYKIELYPLFMECNFVEIVNEISRTLDTLQDDTRFNEFKVFLQSTLNEVVIKVKDLESERILERLEHTDKNTWLRGMFSLIERLININLTKKTRRSGQELLISLQFIELNMGEKLSLSEVAKYVSISPTYYSKLFKDKIGVNFVDYIKERRLFKSKLLLKHTDLSIYEIAMETGFNESNYFSRVFKEQVGISPTEYRTKENIIK